MKERTLTVRSIKVPFLHLIKLQNAKVKNTSLNQMERKGEQFWYVIFIINASSLHSQILPPLQHLHQTIIITFCVHEHTQPANIKPTLVRNAKSHKS